MYDLSICPQMLCHCDKSANHFFDQSFGPLRKLSVTGERMSTGYWLTA